MTMLTYSGLVRLHGATSGSFDKELDWGVTISQLRLYVLCENRPVELV